MTPIQRLEKFYALFGDQHFDELGDFLSRNVWYMQLNSMDERNSPRGRQVVVAALSNWGQWFPDMSVFVMNIASYGAQMTKRVSGAASSFGVQYSFAGKYVRPMPGLHDRPLKVGAEVNLVVTDTVWMDGALQINCLSSSFKIY